MTDRLSEEQFARQVIDLAATLGWRVFRVEQSTRLARRRSGALVRVRNVNVQGVGFPDLVCVRARDRRLIFAELKRDKGPRGGGSDVIPTPEQVAWIGDLASVGSPVVVRVWRPADIDAIARELA